GINGTFRLSVEGARGAFDVTPAEGINLASFLVRVRDPALVDYEKVQVMNVTLVAREVVPHNPKSSSCLVSVYIRDTNDNIPVFDRDVYEARVPEDAPAGTVIAEVVATDADSGDFGTSGLRYTDLRGSYTQWWVVVGGGGWYCDGGSWCGVVVCDGVPHGSTLKEDWLRWLDSLV
ncbi:Cadherin-like, partial [Trinorchestia longiramus]